MNPPQHEIARTGKRHATPRNPASHETCWCGLCHCDRCAELRCNITADTIAEKRGPTGVPRRATTRAATTPQKRECVK